MLQQQLQVQRMRRVYVWELPVRIYHWINVLVMMTLIATGFFIANPLALQSQHEATGKFTMGWFRYIHFAAAYIFFFNYLFRLYWSFAGNKYANWRQFIPTNFKFIKDLWTIFKVDILMIKRNQEHVAVGHNAMAGFIYFFAFLASLVQILTGFGLYASTATWWFPKMFGWVPAILGGDILTRQVHHWTMWFFILFAVIHIYLVFYHDYIEGRGEMSSMAGGYKFMEDEKFDAPDAPVETPVTETKINPDKLTTSDVATK